MAVRRKLIRSIVDSLLRRDGMNSKPIDIEALATSLGAEIRKKPAPDELSGFLLRDPAHGRIVIGVNSSQSKVRQRFTIAHEIGHFLLHEGERVHVDRTDRIFLVKKRNERSKSGMDLEEVEANVFAAEILMPASLVEQDVDSLGPIDPFEDEQKLRNLAKAYGVSYQALLFRLARLGYVHLE